ncbi:hypothetical protein Hanom_Chr06g00570801 [Helianthus anomalus]
MYFSKKLGTNALQRANHKDHLCTFEKLVTKSKILVNHRDHPCTLLLRNLENGKRKIKTELALRIPPAYEVTRPTRIPPTALIKTGI